MTCIIAVKDSEGVVLGCDTRLSWGESYFPANRPKWIKYDNFVIAFAGNISGFNVLERLRSDPDFRSLGVQNRKAIDRIVLALRTYMAEEGYAALSDVSVKSDSAFMLCTQDRIFMITPSFAWCDVGDRFSIGSGAEVAIGALDALTDIEKYQGHDEISTKLKMGIALNAVNNNIYSCGGPVVIKRFTELRNR